jgi:hypothetical protein
LIRLKSFSYLKEAAWRLCSPVKQADPSMQQILIAGLFKLDRSPRRSDCILGASLFKVLRHTLVYTSVCKSPEDLVGYVLGT